MNSLHLCLTLCSLLGASVAFAGCGGSEAETKETPEDGGAGGAPGSGGASGAGGGIVPLLGPDTAGKACTTADDCAPSGRCAENLTAGSLGTTIGASIATPGGYCTAACAADAECGDGGICFGAVPNPLVPVAGECRRSCETDDDCRTEHECASLNTANAAVGVVPNTCQPRPVIDRLTDEAGKPCSGDGGAVCGEGSCLTGPGFPDGYCTGSCIDDAECGEDGVCVQGLYGSQGACWEVCAVDADCARDAEGYGCADRGDQRVCVAKQQPLPAGVLGEPCSDDGDCTPGACAAILPSNDPFVPTLPAPGGYCTHAEPCADSEACGPGGACTITLAGAVCMEICETPEDCDRAGYACEVRGATNVTVCAPRSPLADGGTGASDAGPPPGDSGTGPDASLADAG